MFKKIPFLSLIFFFLLAMFSLGTVCGVSAQQIPLAAGSIPQFVDPLPLLGTIETVVYPEATQVPIYMWEFPAKVLPSTFVPPAGSTYPGYTWVWGYRKSATAPTTTTPAETYTGPVFVVDRGKPTEIKWINNLPTASTGSNVLFWWTAFDQTLHWADPLNNEANDCNMNIRPGLPPVAPCNQPYSGPVPAVVHLHGGEVPPVLDGGPDAWFTSDGLYQGHAYYTKSGGGALGNEAIYRYPNTQEAAPIWFHDHLLGGTRLNVYAGLAGGYIITDNDNIPVTGNPPPADLNDPTKIIPIVIQDRMFDTNGQLFFPSVGINPEHPFWVPEFVGDVILVNGKTWPYLQVQPNKRYRFLLLNGSNARTYQLDFKAQGKGKPPKFWVISTDGGYLQNPVSVQQLVIMPGERYDVIVDFTGFTAGTTLLLQNSARTPFPGGAPVNRSTTGRVMEFRVTATANLTPPVAPTVTFTPAANTDLRPTNGIVRLTPTTTTPIRRLTLNEVMGPGGPLEILVNNTKWSGMLGTTIRTDFEPVTIGGNTTYYSELPKEGTTEVWEVINMTADAHPIHLHLVDFQLLSRQPFDTRRYLAAYDGSFPGGVYIPGFGPPLAYAGPISDPVTRGDPLNCSEPGAICGGNPDVTPFLLGAAIPATNTYEYGWKDTVTMYPGEVTRIAVRWAPTNATGANLYYPFDPNALGHGYVWHCHIIDHEDNEMMRPDLVQASPSAPAPRDYAQGTDY